MISLDTIRSAILSDRPFDRMHELVVAEMANGRKVNDIVEELHPLIDDVLDTPALPEDGEEAFMSTLDALTGNCREDQCYEDPPNTTLPTEEEIAKLPRWARIAFGARCAKRVLPLYARFWPRADRDRVGALTRAVSDLEKWGIASYHPNGEAQDAVANNALDSATVAIAIGAAVLAASRHGSATTEQDLVATADVRVATTHAVTAARKIADITPHICRDFDHLAELARWRYWTDDTPVPPEVFGPLWPEGPPQGWPADPDAPKHDDLPIDLFIREQASPTMIEDDMVHLFKAMNAYHIARGGGPLMIEHLQPFLAALVPAEV